jgi:hypothetical protein
MSYSDFTDRDIIKLFGVRQQLQLGLFADVEPFEASDWLKTTINEGFELAFYPGSEKARSEYLIAPVLLELRKQSNKQISVFSGIEFSVDRERGLTGICDFLVSRSPYQDSLEAPVIVAVEAKREDFDKGLTQCIAEMIAARIYNEQENHPFEEVYGCVTTGDIWRFLVLRENAAIIEKESYDIATNLNKILGILWKCLSTPN